MTLQTFCYRFNRLRARWFLLAIAALATALYLGGCAAPFPADGALSLPPLAAADLALGTVHRADRYRGNGAVIDCNDLAYDTFQKLAQEGYRPNYVVVGLPDGQAHMVVEADGFVWSNYDPPAPWQWLDYKWIAREDNKTHLWYSLKR